MSDESYTPKLRSGVDFTRLSLNGEEGFLLSRIDGQTTPEHLEQLTGFSREKVGTILDRLARAGAIDSAPSAPAGFDASVSAAPDDWDDPTVEDQAPVVDAAPSENRQPTPAPAPTRTKNGPGDDAGGAQSGDTNEGELPAADAADDDGGSDADVADDDGGSDSDAADPEGDADAGDAYAFDRKANYRRLFEETLKTLEPDERLKRVTHGTGPELYALCYDPLPKVIARIVAHEKATRHHARIIAAHHRTSSGLDLLAKRATFLRDAQVQRAIFKNPQLSDVLLTKILAPQRLAEVYKLALSRDVTAKTKRSAQKLFRKKFTQATPDERAQLIIKVEGRCLTLLIGVGIDGRTAALLSQRTIHSTLLIQNLTRWPSCPPGVLAHLFKQSPVKRQANLKNMIIRHPNAPAQLKRGTKR